MIRRILDRADPMLVVWYTVAGLAGFTFGVATCILLGGVR